MVKYDVRPSVVEDVPIIAERIRDADREELWAANRRTPKEALLLALNESIDAYTGTVDGTPVVMFGVSPVTFSSSTGIPWLLASKELEPHFRIFLRGCKAFRDDFKSQYKLMFNYVDARNTVAIKWLKWMGFEIGEAVNYGPDNLPFHPFKMENK